MGIRERNYWIEQAKEQVMKNAKTADDYAVDLIHLYDEAANQLENEIYSIFGRYADKNGLSRTEAEKLLSGDEYKSWKKSVEEYMSQINKEGKDSKTFLELNTLSAKSQISRKEQLLANMYQNMIDLAGDSNTKITDLLGDMLKTNYYRSCYTVQRGVGLGFNVAKINNSLLKQVLSYPWSGKNFSKTVWENTDKLAALAKREITLGFIQGSSVGQMAKEINDIMGKGKMAAERLVRTECSYFANQAELMAYEEMGITQYEFLGGGCEDCQALNGEIFDLNEAEPGINLPPIHPNCKCTTKAAFAVSMFKQKPGANPLASNVKFEEWKQNYAA